MSNPAKDRVQGMLGSAERWGKVSPKAVVAGSTAQAENVLTDAIHDIGCLWATCREAADTIDRLTRELAEAQNDRDYWKVEAEGERAKVGWRDKQLARISASIAEQVMIMDGQNCRLIIGFETPAKTQEAFDVLGEATWWADVTPPPRALKEKP